MTGPSLDAGPIVQGCALARGFDEECDVVVVGSGAGGAVVAALLAEAGRRVIVLEEGSYYSPSTYGRFAPTESMRRLWREAALFPALGLGQTPVISVAAGRCVGGSSVLTGGVCFRIPPEIHRHWVRDLGLADLGEGPFQRAYEDVERRSHIATVPAQTRSYATRRLVQGAESLGITMKPTRRNTKGCQGNSRCNLGCPVQAKQSVDVTYLPSALAHGARLVSDALVEQIEVRAGRAVGVRGRLLGGDRKRTFRVRAPVVVVACGTLHTPLLLLRSGIASISSRLGRDVTLHPAVRVSALFDDPLDGHNGAFQAVYSDHFAREGLTIVGLHPPLNVLASALPGIGAAYRARIDRMRGIGVIGGLVHDDGGGRVSVGPGREPMLWYRMQPRDLARVRRLITVLGEIAFAAGATEVYPPVFGVEPIRTVAQLRALERAPLDARRIECMAFHPLGSARISRDPRDGIVASWGETHEVSQLYIADGSVLPTSIGVNSQEPVMAMATMVAWQILDRTRAVRGRAPANGTWKTVRWLFSA